MTPGAPPERSRRERVEEALREADLAGAIVTHLPNIRYLTGFTGSSATLVHRLGRAWTLITDSRYAEQAAEQVDEPVTIHVASKGWSEALGEIWDDGVDGRVAFEPEHLTVAGLERLGQAAEGIEAVAAAGLVSALRAVKGPEEIARIEAAGRLAEEALAEILEHTAWTAGPTEISVAASLERALRERGSERHPFETIVASGPRSSLPHASPSKRPIERGDLLLVDFGATVDGYCCDITRTFVVGAPADWQSDVQARVFEAQAAAIAAIAPGIEAVAVDAAARDVLASYDLAERFGHGTGHGIGLEIHEDPRLSSRSDDVLVEGNVVTVEPGVYLPGRGGIRIEDDVAVAAEGRRVLTSAPRDLIRL